MTGNETEKCDRRLNKIESTIDDHKAAINQLRTAQAVNEQIVRSIQSDLTHIRAKVDALSSTSLQMKGVWYAVGIVAAVLFSCATLVLSLLKDVL